MKQDLPVLHVRMFGGSQISYGETPVLSNRNNVTRAMKLLMILLHYQDGIARGKLLEYLYGREEMADPSNNLRVTTHRLKKMLVDEQLPDYDYISIKNGIYHWDSPMETEVDADRFRDLIERAENAKSESEEIALLSEACEMYTGEFLENLSSEEWVLVESARYRGMYSDALQRVCAYLQENRRWDEALALIEPACRMYPFDEWQSVKIDCYIAMGKYKDALEVYEDTVKMFFEELGISPSAKMMNQLNAMSVRVTSKPQVLSRIKSELKEEGDQEGAFYCSFPSFRDEYRLIRRIMERNGQSIYLMLCTITNSKGHPLEPSDRLNVMSDKLRGAIKNCLRRCDSFTRYNAAQYLILLVGTNGENCNLVSNRIAHSFASEHKSWSKYLDFFISSVADMEGETEELHFKE